MSCTGIRDCLDITGQYIGLNAVHASMSNGDFDSVCMTDLSDMLA